MTKLIVWFDGTCPLCQREIAWMQRLDTRHAIEFIDLTEHGVVCPIDKTELLKRFHAQENGVLLSGAAAFAAMWRSIPVLRPLGLLARHEFVLSFLEKLYLIFLNYRPRIQRFVSMKEKKI